MRVSGETRHSDLRNLSGHLLKRRPREASRGEEALEKKRKARLRKESLQRSVKAGNQVSFGAAAGERLEGEKIRVIRTLYGPRMEMS